jgi:hypothetical protein
MKKEKVVRYNVWVHIEGVNKEGDTIEGDDYYEPHKAGEFKKLETAEEFRDMLVDTADRFCGGG